MSVNYCLCIYYRVHTGRLSAGWTTDASKEGCHLRR